MSKSLIVYNLSVKFDKITFGLFGGNNAITSLDNEIYFFVNEETLIPVEEICGDCIDLPS